VALEGVVVEVPLAFPPGEGAAAEIAPRAGKVHAFFHSLNIGLPVDGSLLRNTIPPIPPPPCPHPNAETRAPKAAKDLLINSKYRSKYRRHSSSITSKTGFTGGPP
jgi:hypothetical protein